MYVTASPLPYIIYLILNHNIVNICPSSGRRFVSTPGNPAVRPPPPPYVSPFDL
jgi:hypothetical protein